MDANYNLDSKIRNCAISFQMCVWLRASRKEIVLGVFEWNSVQLDARPCWGPQGTRIAPWLFVVMMNDVTSHRLEFEQVSTVKNL